MSNMKYLLLMTACLAAFQAAVSPDTRAGKPAELRVGTYNLRRAPLDAKDPDNNWKVREPRLIQSILDNEFDLCGLQEVDSAEQESIPRMLAERGVAYDSYFFGPYADDGHGTKAHGLLWRKDRFKLVGEPHYFWISNPPDKKQVNDIGSNLKGKFIRGGFCVVLKDRKCGRKYFMMVTHAPLNKEQHAANAHVFIDMERKYNPKGYPSFFVGDFNAREEHAASAVYRSWWTDSYRAFDDRPELRKGPEGTFNGWKLDQEPVSRIDFIYFRGKGVTPLRYVCNDARYDGFFPSDHFPVYVDFEIK
jgi:endonuclease/exonuclease/phosphatase family metal-dependent hydrolase